MAVPRRPHPDWVYHVRRVTALILLVWLVALPFRACSGPGEPEVPEATSTAVPEPEPEPEPIAASRPVALRIPSIGLTASFERGDCRVVDGVIDPASITKACAYTSADKPYQLPGPDASDVVVIAGHAAAGVPAVFDKLYNPSGEAHTVAPGDVLYLRTETSGKEWLRYRATDLHEPTKDELAADTRIWGTAPTPGRLITITCVQPANPFEDAVRNAVVGWQFEGISLHDDTL